MPELDYLDQYFSEAAKWVLRFAREEAQRFHHTYIGTGHLLLGLLRGDQGDSIQILKNVGVDFDGAQKVVESILGWGDQTVRQESELGARAKQVIELAIDEARRLHHSSISPTHLLLGIVRIHDEVATSILERLNVDREKIYSQAIEVLRHSDADNAVGSLSRSIVQEAPADTPCERFDKFTERARKVLSLALEEAQRFNHTYIGTEHLLLGLVQEDEGFAAKVLGTLGSKPEKVRSAVELIIGRGDQLVLGEIKLTPRAKKVIELAVDEAHQLNHHYIGPEHFLLGLVREGEGIAAGVLESLGVNLELARRQTMEILSQSSGSTHDVVPNLVATIEKLPRGLPPGQLEQMNEQSKDVLHLAQEEARCANQKYLSTECLLIGLLKEGGRAAHILSELGIDLNKLHREVGLYLIQHDENEPREIEITQHVKKVIELAAAEAHRLNHPSIGPEHLLFRTAPRRKWHRCGRSGADGSQFGGGAQGD